MAHFRGTLQGSRGEASRLGTKASGLDTTTDGWTSGVRVYGCVRGGLDTFDVNATKGSGYGNHQGFIGYVRDGFFFFKKPGQSTPRFRGHRTHGWAECPRCNRSIKTLDINNLLCKKCYKELTK